ncbi:MAG: glycine cleavage system protein GcvH [Gammaproteobacteria bacterium]|nr:glycine cleavage system protein GcvH [Gammaproteobacteria bacterium]
MSNIPAELKYAKSHEWVKDNGDGTFTVGITDHAQEALGDLVFVETPEVGDHFSAGDDFAVVESVKAASDVYAPISGEVTQANEALADAPETVNDSPYEDGWIAIIKADDASEVDALLDAEGYEASLED